MIEWISVKDEMPENLKFVLGIMEGRFIFVGVYRKCDNTWYMPDQNGSEKCMKVVTHWMQLPEPPKEEDDE